jgi:hypothetical protein
MVLNDRLQQMLSDLRRALYEAISDSEDVHRAWRQLREDGYSLFLTVDCKREEDERDGVRDRLALAAGGEPVFQLNGRDVAFLRSIGIDPIRRRRRRSAS